jgi:Protein of unknown function (DUF3352)
MKLRSFFSVLLAVVVLLLSIGAAGLVWLTAQSPLGLLKGGGTSTQPAAAMFVPRQAPLMVSLLVNPDRLDALRRVVARPGDRRRAVAELDQFKQSLLANTDLSYERDVQPWLGEELTWAVTSPDFDRDGANGRQPGYLLAVATNDPDRSREFLQLLWQKRAISGVDLVFEQYKGVKLIYSSNASAAQPGDNSPAAKSGSKSSRKADLLKPRSAFLASAVVGDRFVLFANHPKVLRDAINNVQAPDLSLGSASFYTRSLDSLTQPRIGFSFVNLPRLASWQAGEETSPKPSGKAGASKAASSKPASSKATIPPAASSKEPSTPKQTLAIALELKPQGLLAETALLTLDGQAETVSPTLTEPVGALEYLPAQVSLAAAGQNLNQVWKRLNQGLAGYETAEQLVNRAIADLEQQWQIDLPQDVFSWVTGEYALGLLPATGSKLDAANWIFVAQKTQAEAAQEGLARLDTIAQKQGLTIGALPLGSQTVSAWTRLTPGKRSTQVQAEVRGVHTSVGNYELFASSLAGMEQAIAALDHPLSTADRFQEAITPLDQPNNGYLFVDWAEGRGLLEQQLPILKVLELTAKPLVEHLRSLTLSSYGSAAGIQRSGIFVRLN